MIKLQEVVGLPTLHYHLDNKLTLSECIYRYSSDSFIQLFTEARQALRDGKIALNKQDMLLIETTDIGEYGMYEGEKVALDLPMVDEGTFEDDEIAIYDGKDGLTYIYRRENGYYGYNDDFDFVAKDREELEQKLNSWGYRLQAGSLDEGEYRGKDVPLNKPKRGGSKKFYVYTKNKKGNVVRVSFGAAGGGQNLSVKLDDPKRRKAFADRHNCDQKTDKTTPGYWSCRLTRYSKSLGMSKNYSGYW